MIDSRSSPKSRPTHRVARMKYPPMAFWAIGIPQETRPEVCLHQTTFNNRPKPKKLVELVPKEEIVNTAPEKSVHDMKAVLPGGFDIIQRGNFPCITFRDGQASVLPQSS